MVFIAARRVKLHHCRLFCSGPIKATKILKYKYRWLVVNAERARDRHPQGEQRLLNISFTKMRCAASCYLNDPTRIICKDISYTYTRTHVHTYTRMFREIYSAHDLVGLCKRILFEVSSPVLHTSCASPRDQAWVGVPHGSAAATSLK